MITVNMSKYLITRTRKFHPLPGLWNGITQTGKITKKIHGTGLNTVWLYAKNGEYIYLNNKHEFSKTGNFIKQRIIDDKNYLADIYQRQFQAGKKLAAHARKLRRRDLKKLSLNKLFALYSAVREGWIKHDILNVPPWHIGGDYFYQHLNDRLKNDHMISKEEITVLFTPNELSFSAREELAMLELALEVKNHQLEKTIEPDDATLTLKKLPPKIKKKLNTIVNNYYWIPFGYDGPALYDLKHYLASIKELMAQGKKSLKMRKKKIENFGQKIETRQKAIIKKYGVAADLWILLKRAQLLPRMTDQRKEFTFQAHVAFDLIIAEISGRIEVEKLMLKYITLEELRTHQADLKWLTSTFGKRYPGPVIYHYNRGKLLVVMGKKVKAIESEIFPTIDRKDVIHGIVASMGRQTKTKGKIRLLSSAREAHKLIKGEILVTAMTTPEFVPAMRKSKAIITDEGGMTCHAAIVSRELNLPCVIGTKIATKVLNDGDLVEVDTRKGIVNIIKKS
jgi:phosphohistidine swiveling domain-containing protein